MYSYENIVKLHCKGYGIFLACHNNVSCIYYLIYVPHAPILNSIFHLSTTHFSSIMSRWSLCCSSGFLLRPLAPPSAPPPAPPPGPGRESGSDMNFQ